LREKATMMRKSIKVLPSNPQGMLPLGFENLKKQRVRDGKRKINY